MAKQKNKPQNDEVLVDVSQKLSSAEKFFEENRKSITVIAVALFAIVGGYFAYLYFYQQPREKEAQEEIFFAQMYMEQDSLRLALQGDGQHYGFVEIAEQYEGTKAGNLANYYAGVSFLNRGEYQRAIEYLDEFDSDDEVYSVLATGAIGDAFLELNQPEEALEYYNRAVSGEENGSVVPFILMKAGLLAEQQGEYKDALSYFSRIKDEFKDSPQAVDIEKYIARAEAQNQK